ncbi:heavy-metal-associated domain-containing protein [Arthrobacter sp. QXT-31]|uniref:heavy-metal-associated domain-containing protein n=1 Tax=Arthrobacter sp. QXT-31 TaxID=1357915 RepID=UPI0009718667|nr:cation transporter [Arthrobacter sp. QXT-31]APX00517.1 heavy metal transporter [Arthrobacter sp. QXT-31]
MSPVTTTLNISGMTCGHCVASVTEELEALEDVISVTVELNKGGISRAAVIAGSKLPAARLTEAVAAAGYAVVSGDA